MLIREQQLTEFSRSMNARAAPARVVELRRLFPTACHFAGQAALEGTAAACAEAAEKFDFGSAAATRLFLHWTMMFGTRFFEDPQFAWLRELLYRDLALPHLPRVQVIEWNVWAYQDRASGVRGEFDAAAWAKVSTLDARHWNAISADIGSSGGNWMFWLHPQRAKFVRPDAYPTLVEAAFVKSARLGLDSTESAALIAVIMFLFGSDALDSTVHTWIRASLDTSGAAGERCRRLVGRLTEYARAMVDEGAKKGAH